jgi:hypothetical protein
MKKLHTFSEFLNESKVDLRLSTHEQPKGVMNPYRLESSVISLRSVLNLSRDPWAKTASSFSETEIGFDSSSDREKAMSDIEKLFNSGKLKIQNYAIKL